MDFKEITEKQMDAERFLLQSFRERFEKCPPGYLTCKPDRTGRLQYYHKLPGDPKPHYLNRTKAEASVAELLYGSGLSFHYEKKLILQDEDGALKTRYPDFTIPIAPWLDYYLEYDGMFQKEAYRKRHEETMRLYHLNGIYPPKNLMILMEGPDGSFHADSILQTIEGILVPLCSRYSSSRCISAASQNPHPRH